ncbi:methyltransferase [Mycolicibacterium mageritense]
MTTRDARPVDREKWTDACSETALPAAVPLSVIGGNRHQVMQQLIFDSRSIAQLLRCAAVFNLADHLADAPLPASVIAEREHLDEGAAYRLLRACAGFGLVNCDEEMRFATTPLLATLQKDDPMALRDAAITEMGYAHWVSWGRLAEAVRTGQPQFPVVSGQHLFEYYAGDGREEGTIFARSMVGFNTALASEIAKLIDTGDVGFALDVGGANGSMLLALMKANPSLRGAVLDLAHVRNDALAAAAAAGMAERFDFHEGDFFANLPTADLYILKHILHDWPDEKAAVILDSCRRAASTGARLVVAELILDSGIPSRLTAEIDLTMLTLVGGRERTADDFQRLLSDSSFEITAIKSTSTPFSFIEAVAK